jgi:hypothetical protein
MFVDRLLRLATVGGGGDVETEAAQQGPHEDAIVLVIVDNQCAKR